MIHPLAIMNGNFMNILQYIDKISIVKYRRSLLTFCQMVSWDSEMSCSKKHAGLMCFWAKLLLAPTKQRLNSLSVFLCFKC